MTIAGRRAVLLICIGLLALTGPPAGASPRQDEPAPTTTEVDPPSWAVEPGGAGERSWFVYQLAPGQSLRDSIALENPTEEPITFDIYPTDAFTTEDVGAWALDEPGETPDDVGSWIEVGQTQYTVAPGRRVEIPFEITVPPDARPGDHAGGVVGANVKAEETVDSEGATVSLKRRIGARVYVRVEGPLEPALSVTRLDLDADSEAVPLPGGASAVVYEVENVGNVRLTPTAHLETEGLFGHTVAGVEPRQLPELLPGSSVKVVVEDDGGVWPLDRVSTSLRVEANDVSVTRSTSSWVLSPGLVAVVAVLLGAWLIRRRRRHAAAGGGEEPDGSREKVLVDS